MPRRGCAARERFDAGAQQVPIAIVEPARQLVLAASTADPRVRALAWLRRLEVQDVRLGAASDQVSTIADQLDVEKDRTLQPAEIDPLQNFSTVDKGHSQTALSAFVLSRSDRSRAIRSTSAWHANQCPSRLIARSLPVSAHRCTTW
ncbi:MAG TPA: hypothetical protein VGI92_05180 [Gemmatimonadales bacterium]|jgi:hypothetical protein